MRSKARGSLLGWFDTGFKQYLPWLLRKQRKKKWSLKRGNNRKGLFLNVLGFTGVSPVMVLSINYHAQDLEFLPSLRHTGA